MTRKILYLFILSSVLGFLAGCPEGGNQGNGSNPGGNSTPRAQKGKNPKRLVMNIGTEPGSIDPSLVEGIPAAKIMQGLMEGLISLDENCEAQPAAALSWEHNDNADEWTFHLREGAKWHNGDPVVAGDFVYGLKRILTSSNTAQYSQYVADHLAGGIEYYKAGGLDGDAEFTSAAAPDDSTLVLHLSNPTPHLLAVISHSSWLPINERAVKEAGTGWAMAGGTFVGNGPFELKSYSPRDRLVMSKSDQYWAKDDIFWEEVEVRFIEEENTENTAFMTGELDITESIPLPLMDQFRETDEFFTSPYLGTYYVGFNVEKAPFDDVRVRRAFSMAINRNLIVDRVTRRAEPVAKGHIPIALASADPEYATFRERAGDLIGPQDIEGAKELLKEAGYDESNPLPQIEYLYNTSDEHKLIAEQLQAMWTAMGADVRLRNVEWGVRLNMTAAGEFQFARLGWISDYLDAMSFLDLFTTGNPQNDPNLANARYDELLKQARSEPDPIKREGLMIEAEKILIDEEVAVAPLFYYTEPFLRRTEIKNLKRNAVGDLLYTQAYREVPPAE